MSLVGTKWLDASSRASVPWMREVIGLTVPVRHITLIEHACLEHLDDGIVRAQTRLVGKAFAFRVRYYLHRALQLSCEISIDYE